ncbi:hypothetical protein BJV82DRAFT_229165 [Fennellomyces sp. T-0311]|nr:hypothetical protein BJV82DRAFT_229165 [Fennellomyces sp. T-0311]
MVNNRRRERCLGKHVKKIMFQHLPDEEQLYDAMRGLYKCNCTNIETIRFIRCATANQDVFIPLLRQLATRVTRIELLRHRTNVPFLHLLNACPSLTHFSFQAATDSYNSHGVYDKEPKLHERISLRDQFPNIVYLRLNSIMDERRRVEPILMWCPNLRIFIGAEYGAHAGAAYLGIGINPVYVRLDKLLSWCPKIAHIQTTSAFGYFSTTIQHRISDSAYPIGKNDMTDGDHCLRQLATSSNYGLDKITRLLKANQQTLEYVSLENHGESFNWSPTLRSISLIHVHTLAFYDLKFDTASLIILLNNCPVVATLVIRDTRLIFDHHSFGLFGPMNYLRTLEMTTLLVFSLTVFLL